MFKKFILFTFITIQIACCGYSYANFNFCTVKTASCITDGDTTVKEKDIIDVINSLRGKQKAAKKDTAKRRYYLSLLPSAGYTLSTGFAVDLSGSAVFYTNPTKQGKLSNVFSNITYDQHQQFLFHTNSVIWSKHEDYAFIGDWRFLKYPENTFGLGSLTTKSATNLLDYKYLRFYETVLKRVASNFYTGFGYNLDFHYNISEGGNADGTVSDFRKYGYNAKSVSSGLTYNLLYDDRLNPVNPINGIYANAIYRTNFSFLGSDMQWQSLTFDLRKYVRTSKRNNNVLAFWMLDWVTLGGNPPYLDLPSIGWDNSGNTGRGYPQGRFRGRSMLYLESEYRFNISRNQLFGGVLFANAESFSNYSNNHFDKVLPAFGPGLRIKFNKQARTNLCVDYGIGLHSQGFFVNLGEVF